MGEVRSRTTFTLCFLIGIMWILLMFHRRSNWLFRNVILIEHATNYVGKPKTDLWISGHNLRPSMLSYQSVLKAPDTWKSAVTSLSDSLMSVIHRQNLRGSKTNNPGFTVRQSLSNLDERVIRTLDRLSSYIQNRINETQNPKTCTNASYVIADLNGGCGFGCTMHHLARCLQLAHMTGRILSHPKPDKAINHYMRNWIHFHFLPLAHTCTPVHLNSPDTYPVIDEVTITNSPIVRCSVYPAVQMQFIWKKKAFSGQFLHDLSLVHHRPFAWFTGQVMAYIMRPTASLKQDLLHSLSAARLLYRNSSPIVGVHIRRTDKLIWEAKYHALDEYMLHVEKYFQTLENISVAYPLQRRVYLSSDDARVFEEARTTYKRYTFYGDKEHALKGTPANRLNDQATKNIFLDVVGLSLTNYLVCTFSSNIGRLAYELMQTMHHIGGDAAKSAHSIDDNYLVHGQNLNLVTLPTTKP